MSDQDLQLQPPPSSTPSPARNDAHILNLVPKQIHFDDTDISSAEKNSYQGVTAQELPNRPLNIDDQPTPPSTDSAWEVTRLILRRTGLWIVAGLTVTLLGISLVQACLLPKIHTCPPNGACPTFFDPNKSNILNLLQTLMSYWLKLGLVLSAFGLIKLSAYQAWFSTMRHGNTIDNLDLTLGAIKGGLLDAIRLVLRKRTTFISLLVLGQLGISTIITLFVGLAIVRTNGEREVTFMFPDVSQLPDSSIANLNSDGQVRAISKVVSWALTNDTTHDHALRGTLVVPDGRSNASVNAVPEGPIIDGSFECQGIPRENVTIVDNGGPTKAYSINFNNASYMALPSFDLAVSQTKGIGTAVVPYIWVSNSTGLLPNATVVDGGIGTIYVTLCRHYVFMRNATQNQPNTQSLLRNIPNIPGCRDNWEVCVADSVSNAILSWWGGLGQSFWLLSCRGGVLGPIKSGAGQCSFTTELWRETATSMLDGIMQTAPTQGNSIQTLLARVEIINPRRWWLQGVIPLLTLLLYLVALAYTVYLSEGNPILKELNLAEIIGAAQTDDIRDLIQQGRLRKSLVRYGSNVGFLNHQVK